MSIDLNLDRLKELTKNLPPYTRPTIHIAGTNGKGSVSAILTSILLAHPPSAKPFRIGRYNSPHLVTILDCITIDNTPISPTKYAEVRRDIEDVNRRLRTQLTNFELLTITALRIFEDEKVDIVILEVGMGGRLDATNIIPTDCILASVLTAVDLDHQAFLGDTITKIAEEKAGIARSGKLFILGKQSHAEVEEVVIKVVKDVGAHFIPAIEVYRDTELTDDLFSLASPLQNGNFSFPGAQHVMAGLPCFESPTPVCTYLPLHGDHQLDNLGTALTTISAILTHDIAEMHQELDLDSRITILTIEDGIRNVSWPGRLSFHSVNTESRRLLVLADGAHNEASSKTLAAYLETLLESTSKAVRGSSTSPPIPITFILGLSHTPPKAPLQTLAPLFSSVLSSTAVAPLNISLNVALLPFTCPEGMPWVKSVPTSVMRDTVAILAPKLSEDAIWVAKEPTSPNETDTTEKSNMALKEALDWAAQRHSVVGEGQVSEPGLVVLAGSLYLVADFYRLLEKSADM